MTLGEMFGLSELSERFFGEGMEGLEKRRRCCAWLSLPAAIVAFLMVIGGLIFLAVLHFAMNPLAFLLLVVPTSVIVFLAGYCAVFICSHGIDCASRVGRLVSAVGMFISLIIFLFSLLGLFGAIVFAIGEATWLITAGIGTLP